MKKLIVMIIVIAALNITLYAIDSTSIYAELSTDTIVSRPLLAPYSGTVLIERNINLPIKAQVLFQSDGRIFPYNKLGPAGILIRVDGMDISNESKIDFRSKSPAQHCYNCIGAIELNPGQHKVQLIGYNIVWYTFSYKNYEDGEGPTLVKNWGQFKVGHRSNLSIIVNPSQNVIVSNTTNTNCINVTTYGLYPPSPIPYEPIMVQSINTNGPVITFASGSAESCYSTQGDAMWGILLNGSCGSNDHMFWSVNDLTGTTEYVSPMYCQSMYDFNGPADIVLAGAELPWDSQHMEDPVQYFAAPSTRLISLYGGFQILGKDSLSSENCFPNDYMDTGVSTVIWEQTFEVPQSHNGNIMFVGKTRVIEGPNVGYGNAYLELNLDGVNVGSYGTQQLDLGCSGQQRTMTVSYLGLGLTPGLHIIRGIMHQSGSLPKLACTKDLGLIFFD